MKKRIIAILTIMMMGLALTSCGNKEEAEESQDILSQEVELGVNLENKAKDAVETQGEQAGESDAMLDSIPTD